MFELEDFENNPRLKPIIAKINKFLKKEKLQKVKKYFDQLEELLDTEDVVPISYIYSLMAETHVEFLSETLIEKLAKLFSSEDEKVKNNAVITVGFYLLSHEDKIGSYFDRFMSLLLDESNDVKENAYFFLQQFLLDKTDLVSKSLQSHKRLILKAIKSEENVKNLTSLLRFLNECKSINFKQLYDLREWFFEVIPKYKKDELFLKELHGSIEKYFPSLKELNLSDLTPSELVDKLKVYFLMKKYNFSKIYKEKRIGLKDFIKKIRNSRKKLLDRMLYFYVKDKEKNLIHFYEMESEKLLNFFKRDTKISSSEIAETFSEILRPEEIKNFVTTLIRLGQIEGYYSKLGFYYPKAYLMAELASKLQKKGMVNLKSYNYLPPKFLDEIISEIKNSTNLKLLNGQNNTIFYSLKHIQEQIIKTAAKNSSIDLKAYRKRLNDEDFIKLIKNLPQEYLTKFHKGTNWLTNIGKFRIMEEINNSKIIGYLDINRVNEKLKINKLLLIDIFDIYIDARSGVWDKRMERFYYSVYLKEKIEKINLIPNEEEKNEQINKLALHLNIDKNHILSKIDENYKLIGEEIKGQEQINISEYLEKTGFTTQEDLFRFIDDLEINYLKKGEILILKPSRIEEAQKQIKSMIIEKSKSEEVISLGTFDIKSEMVKDLIDGLQSTEEIKGIFYEEGEELNFYTEVGIRHLMLENKALFNFEDLFYGKELTGPELKLIRSVFDQLKKENQLKGNFDEETMTFFSDEVIFANDYNLVVDEFISTVNTYIKHFDREFNKIKKILTKSKQTIFPQEIKQIQDSIDKINISYVKWKADLEAMINKCTRETLRKQGYSLKRYNEIIQEEKKKEIKLFSEDQDVYDAMKGFQDWVSLFNELEIKYGKIIFLQKKCCRIRKTLNQKENWKIYWKNCIFFKILLNTLLKIKKGRKL